jgi:N-ethylmaleimide reductase
MSDENPIETFGYAARALNRFGLAYLHVVETAQSNAPQGMEALGPTALCREAFEGTLITNGEYTRQSGEQTLQQGRADLIAYGRLFLANPDLPARFKVNAPLNTPDPDTFYGGGEQGYTDYPALAQA